MTDILHKTFRTEVKGVDEKEGIIDMLIPMSTASVDRDGESIDPLGWRKSLPAFRKRPVLLSSHNYGSLMKQIGEFTQIKVSEDGLFAKPKYYINEGNEEADWAFRLASKGMAAYSVGFIPKQWTDGDGEKTPARTYTEQELLEISHVVVPSNRDAIQGLRGKSADPTMNQLIEDLVNSDVVDNTDRILEIENSIIHKHEKKEYSQPEIADEIDFVKSLVLAMGVNDEIKERVRELYFILAKSLGYDSYTHSEKVNGIVIENGWDIRRTPGSDMPAQIDGINSDTKTDTTIDNDRLKAIIDQTVTHVINHI